MNQRSSDCCSPLPCVCLNNVLREWGNDLGFTQLPKFTYWESLTPVPPPLASNHIRNLSRITPQSKMIKPLLNHQSSVCCDRFLPTSCLCFLLAQEVLHLILTHLLSLITGTKSSVRVVGRFGAVEPHIPQHL